MTAPATQYDHLFHGCHLRSSIPLPSLPDFNSDAPADITLVLGETPRTLENTKWSSPFIQIGADNSVLITVAAVARFYLKNGCHVVVQPACSEANDDRHREMESIFLGTVAGLLLHQRSLIPLQASCVVIHNRAVAISGNCGYGKSALAAALIQRGATLLADGICVTQSIHQVVHATAGTKRVCLWADVMDHLDIPSDHRREVRANHGKHSVDMPVSDARSYPLAALVRLNLYSFTDKPMLERVHGLAAVLPAKQPVYQRDIGQLLGNSANEFRTLTALARSVPIFSLKRTRLLHDLDRCVDLILSAVEENM